jgi:hypothetical protein
VIIRDNPTLRDPTYCHGVYSAFRILDRFVQQAENTPGCFYELSSFLKDSRKYQQLLEYAEESYPGLTVIDSTNYFCGVPERRCELFKDGRLLYSYSDHLSDYAADFVSSKVILQTRRSIL